MSKNPPKKATQPLGKTREVPLAASSTTPAQSQRQPVKAPETRTSRSTNKQDQSPNRETNPTTSHQAAVELPPTIRTRSDERKWKEFLDANEIIQKQLQRIRGLYPVTLAQPQQSSSKSPSKKPVNRGVVKEIDDFYSALIDDEQFRAAKLKEENLDPESGLEGGLPFRPTNIIRYIHKDFATDLKSRKDNVAEIIRGGMSLTYSDGGKDAEGEAQDDEDPDADIAEELGNKVDDLKAGFGEIGTLISSKIVSRSFSTIRRKDYHRLGVEGMKPVPAMTVCLNVLDGIKSREWIAANFSQAWEDVLEQMKLRIVDTIDNFWNILSEESTRFLVNDLKYSLVSAKVVGPGGTAQIVCFPEFSLGSLPKSNAEDPTVRKGTAVTIENSNGHKTRLSGSTDYFTFSTTDPRFLESLKKERSSWRGSAMELYGRIMERWSTRGDAFVIVEAKSPLTHLETHVPQVVAEAIALAHSRDKPYVPFCLTSGALWIFGVLHKNDNKRTFWRTTPIPFRPTPGGILLILAILLSWASVKPEELWVLKDANRDNEEGDDKD